MDYLLSLTPDEAAQAVSALPLDEQMRVALYLMAELTVLSQQLLQQPPPPKVVCND